MERIPILNFEALGGLLVPWPTIEQPSWPSIRELAEDSEHPALHVRHPDQGGWTHAKRIEYWLERPQALGVLEAPAARLADGSLVLQDRCHRACAVYRLRPAQWILTLRV